MDKIINGKYNKVKNMIHKNEGKGSVNGSRSNKSRILLFKRKIKLNWFCYEYAFSLYTKIRESYDLVRYRSKHDQKEIVDYFLYFSIAMKKWFCSINLTRMDFLYDIKWKSLNN